MADSDRGDRTQELLADGQWFMANDQWQMPEDERYEAGVSAAGFREET